MITDLDYANLLDKMAKYAKDVRIITSNIYVGINYNSVGVVKPIKAFDDFLNKTTQVILNINDIDTCKFGCLHCQSKYFQNVLKLVNTIEHYSNIDWRIIRGNYNKIQLIDCDKSKFVVIGKNLSSSNFDEVFYLSDNLDDFKNAERIYNNTLLQTVKYEKGYFDKLLSSQAINVDRLSEFF